MTVEDQVALVCEMLESVGRDSIWDPQSGFGQLIPCSFRDLDAWVRLTPDAETGRIAAEAATRLTFTDALAGIDPHQLAGLGSVAPDDPLIPALTARLAASWPSRDKVAEIVRLYGCACRTVGELAQLRPQMAKGSPLGEALDKAARDLGTTTAAIAADMESTLALLTGFIDFYPRAGLALRLVEVRAPDINLMFAHGGSLTVTDAVSPLRLAGAPGQGFLQSRHASASEPGTPAAGLTAYEFRLSLEGIGAGSGVVSLTLPVRRPATLDFAASGVDATGEVFAVTAGGLGDRAPSRAEMSDAGLVLTFDPPLATGEGSVFMGFAAPGSPRPGRAIVIDVHGSAIEIDCFVPTGV